MVVLFLMDGNEQDKQATVKIETHERGPTYVHDGQVYVASYRKPDGVWIYRWERRA